MARVKQELGAAISENEFELYFQPQVLVSSGKIAGCDALICWNHPQRGMISPPEFISVAEECGLIDQLDGWVLESACRQLEQWEHLFGCKNNSLPMIEQFLVIPNRPKRVII
ncbi:EAL domain-containing protein [Desulfobacter sp.]|uniref:EAL domain-containing protein n=1 Tax=Desulfobacter sp. TaxID=2294 RepID=UPI003D11A280